ncbi:hypothetical protein GYA19_02275 [Candidatus Beckwithbacteria bacterium]|nr:hypothetical protein [Candidatus Beckwithbacteria bacterium]
MDTNQLIDIRQTSAYAQFLKLQHWQIVKLQNSQIFLKKLPFLPLYVAKALRYQEKLDYKDLKKNWKIIWFQDEPFLIEKKENNSVYFKIKSKTPLIPTKTLWLDLQKAEKELLANLSQKTRYNLKKAWANFKAEIIFGDKIKSKDFQNFYDLWLKNKPYNWLFKPNFKELQNLVTSFGKQCFFVNIYNQCHSGLDPESIQKNNLLASCLILTSANMAFYWHNASNLEGKKVFAPTLAVWHAILQSKKMGLKIFDFEGLWDERLPKINKGWKGFTRFKLGFAKQ